MLLRGLKINIALNIAILLLLAMLLTDFVVTMKVQRDLIGSVASKGNLLISSLNRFLNVSLKPESRGLSQIIQEYFEKRLNDENIIGALVFDQKNQEVISSSNMSEYQIELEALVMRAIMSKRQQTGFFGETWGVFWKQHHNMMIAAPIYFEDRLVAGAGVIISLESVYSALRHSQKILFIYIFVNTIIFACIGIYLISRMYLRPVLRLVKRAEEYRDEDEMFFFVRKGDNELNKLSQALNRMIRRISGDKEKLRESVSSLEKANADLKQAQYEIIRAEKLAAVGRLSAGIAHEIGNPIGIVMGYLDLLKQKNLSEDEKVEYLIRTEKEINRINLIIRQLLDLSRPSPNEAKRVPVHEVIEDMADILRVQPLMSRVQLKLNLTAEMDGILADAEQIRQVFLNLSINAADAIAAEGKNREGILTVKTTVLEASAREALNGQSTLIVTFEDNGPGIPADQLVNIFDPFYTTKEPGKGTGLGLSVSFMIIEGIGGTIKAASTEGRGTTVSVFLPLYNNG